MPADFEDRDELSVEGSARTDSVLTLFNIKRRPTDRLKTQIDVPPPSH